MVRSLPVATVDEAPGILKALQRYRNRADKPYWVRQVILIGLKLPDNERAAALGLLKHWTAVPLERMQSQTGNSPTIRHGLQKSIPNNPPLNFRRILRTVAGPG